MDSIDGVCLNVRFLRLCFFLASLLLARVPFELIVQSLWSVHTAIPY